MLVMPGENEKLHTRSSEIHTFVLHCGAAQKLLVWQSRTPDFILRMFGQRELTDTAPTILTN